MATLRDTQRNRIIRAEDLFTRTQPRESFQDLGAVLTAIQKRAWWKRQGTPRDCTLEPNRWSNCAPRYYTRQTELHCQEEGRVYLLHALAHVITDEQILNHSSSKTPHSPEFVKNYLELVRRYMDPSLQINEALKKQFKTFLMSEGVKTKAVSEETRDKQRAAMIKRLTPTEEKSLALLAELENL